MKEALHWLLTHSPEGFALAALFTFGMYLRGMYPSLKGNEAEKKVREVR